MKQSARTVQAVLDAHGVACTVRELPASTRTAAEAAAAIGCAVRAIAKSLVFRASDSGAPVLVIAAGDNRVDTGRVAAALGEPLAQAPAAFVRETTGFAIGGVPPVGHRTPPRTFVDRDLLALDTLWAAAGTPHAVFSIRPDELVRICGGQVLDVKQDADAPGG